MKILIDMNLSPDWVSMIAHAGNPVERHGYGVYYFHPQSYSLAGALP